MHNSLPICQALIGDLSADLPLRLPASPVARQHLGQHYSLPKAVKEKEPLHSQLVSLERWCREGIQLDRSSGRVSSATWKNTLAGINLYLGFLYHHLDNHSPTLHCFLDGHSYVSFIAFQRAKDISINTHTQFISYSKKVLAFLSRPSASRQAGALSIANRAEQVSRWLDILRQQLVKLVPRKRKDVGEEMAEGRWIEADKLVRLIKTYTDSVLQQLPPTGQLSSAMARALHDACLLSFMFGHIPPCRLICLRTLLTPHTPGCHHPDCVKQGCKGNRLVLTPGGKLRMLLSHYKVDARCAAVKQSPSHLPIFLKQPSLG